ncbi:MAG TPA: hypothetical protein VK972_01880 [Wenzhouxiangella sp.]|nr:hypothetical protein [Wenzhouxiangella sp.]
MSSDKRWHRLDLGDALLAESEVAEIRERAELEFERLGRPRGWAVYLVHTSGDLHCSALLFFSPAAAELAGRLGAHPSPAPVSQDRGLLAGIDVLQ